MFLTVLVTLRVTKPHHAERDEYDLSCRGNSELVSGSQVLPEDQDSDSSADGTRYVPVSLRRAFTLIELLIVLSLMAVLAGLVLPATNSTIRDQLRSAAQVLSADLAYARSLAVTYGSPCRVSFDFKNHRYILESTLEQLPASPFDDPNGPSDKQIVDLGALPHLGVPVRLEAAGVVGRSTRPTDYVQFEASGETSADDGYTRIWLSAGEGDSKRYFLLSVNPVTGLAGWDESTSFSATGPPGSLVQREGNENL